MTNKYPGAVPVIAILSSAAAMCAIFVASYMNPPKNNLEKLKASAFTSCVESASRDSLHIITPAVIQACQTAAYTLTTTKP